MSEFTTHGLGRTVGSYTLEEEIGRGGMGVVYRARRVDTGETVALKLMLPEISANHHFRARFVREASLGSDLDHPNIVPIYDAGQADGELYLAMRLVEGRDLKAVLEAEGRLEPKRLLGIMRQVASALDAAHEAGIVHHDVKPQNILIATGVASDKDLAFVSDFGLVRPAGSESTASRTGQVFGSIQYMPPEQVEGLPADGRADVYALGCVLYECLTGQIPFDRPNEVAVLWAHVHEQPARVTDANPQLPGGVDAVVATAMAKHPDDRFLTCGELIEELEKGLERKHRPIVMPVVRPLVKRVPRRKTEREVWAPNYFPELSRVRKLTERTNWVQVVGVIAILSVLGAALVQFAHPRGLSGAVGDVATAVGNTVLDAGKSLTAALGPDEDERVDRPGRTRAASSRRNAFDRGQTDVSGDFPAARTQVQPRPAAAGPGADANAERQTTPSPLSRRMAFVSTRDGSYDIFTARRDGSDTQQVTTGAAAEFAPAFSPDGTRIAFARSASAEGLLECPPTGPCPYVSHIYVVNVDGSGLTQVSTGSNVWDSDPVWSPDGHSIVFSRWAGDENADLYILTQSEGSWTQSVLTDAPGSETEPAFSPDGTKIVYSGDPDTDRTWSESEDHMWDLFVLDSAGNVSRLTERDNGNGPTWSPNGSRIAFYGKKGLFFIRADGSGLTRLTRADDASVDWAPDGTKLAFQRCGDLIEKCRLMTYDFADRKFEVVIDDVGDYDGSPSWSPPR
jgi:Tol biopolymer transport system component